MNPIKERVKVELDEEAIEEARKLNPYDFRIFAFDRVIN